MLRSLSDSSRNAPWDSPVCALIWESSTKGSWNSALALPAKPGSPVEGHPLNSTLQSKASFCNWYRDLYVLAEVPGPETSFSSLFYLSDLTPQRSSHWPSYLNPFLTPSTHTFRDTLCHPLCHSYRQNKAVISLWQILLLTNFVPFPVSRLFSV